mmetsp:Transcript_88079/g.284452  ORF Transcript_88079/g.284452 Transcript_88079/m.284452 type:complete len:136 (-) Transcript_88079:55-462(-)
MLQLQLQAKEGTSKLEAEAHAAQAKLARAEAIIEQQKARIGDFWNLMQRFVPQPRQFSIATPPHFDGAKTSGVFERGPSSLAPSDLTQGEPPFSRPPAFDYSGAARSGLVQPPPLRPLLSSCGPAAAAGSGHPTA